MEINEIETKKDIRKKINEPKSCFFEKINKIDKPLGGLTHKEELIRNNINNIRNERGDITIDNTEIQSIIREYYE